MKKGGSFFASLFVSVVMVGVTVAPAFAQLGGVVPPVEVTPEPVTQPASQIVAPIVMPSDTTPPLISGVLEASLLPTEATIVWRGVIFLSPLF